MLLRNHTFHPQYNVYVGEELDKLFKQADTLGWNAAKAYDKLEELALRLGKQISGLPETVK